MPFRRSPNANRTTVTATQDRIKANNPHVKYQESFYKVGQHPAAGCITTLRSRKPDIQQACRNAH